MGFSGHVACFRLGSHPRLKSRGREPHSTGDDGSTPPILGLRWQYTTENLAVSLREIQRGDSSQIPRNYRRKRTAESPPSLYNSSPPPSLAPFTRRFQLKRILARIIHVAFSHLRCCELSRESRWFYAREMIYAYHLIWFEVCMI